ncbi:hypothetical protein ABIE61_003731 [Marinobacterium sp. MBR-111]|jgi:hypothetical protein
MARKKYQHYTDEFRREAVRRADQPGHTASSVAKELGYILVRSTTGDASLPGCLRNSSIV